MTKILLVEDNELNRDMLSRRLRRRGYEVEIAVDGAQALAIANRQPFDLILMDMSLPVMDGWEATRQIKTTPTLQNIPVIALTAHAMVGDRERALEAGCDDYDTKPIDLKRLLGKVKAFLPQETTSDGSAPSNSDSTRQLAQPAGHRSEHRSEHHSEHQPKHQSKTQSGPKLLVVDDNPDNRDLLTRRLQRRGYRTPQSDSGEVALQMLQQQSDIALVLLDIMMPGMDGIETLQQIRQHYSRAQLPVVMVTAKSQSDDMVRAFEQGANDYITKPIDFDIALARIQSHLATTQSAANTSTPVAATEQHPSGTFRRSETESPRAEVFGFEHSQTALAERYQIQSILAQEPLGPVAIAQALSTQTSAIVQTLDIPSSTLYSILHAALLDEARQLGSLRSQFSSLKFANLSTGQFDETLYIAHDLGPEGHPENLLQAALDTHQPWPLDSVLALMEDLLQQLEPFHRQNQVHGGLNARCFMQCKGHWRLIDSGLGKRVLMRVSQKSAEYRKRLLMQRSLPMEQRIGRPALSSDLYSIGLLGLQALTGLPLAESPLRSSGTSTSAWQQQSGIPAPLMDWFEHLVSSNPTERYPEAMEASAALRSLSIEKQGATVTGR